MNIELILNLVKPYVKDGAITYDEFEKIFSFLSRKEQYAVCDILFKHGINLIEEHVQEEVLLLDVEDSDDLDPALDEDYEIGYDQELFRDKGSSDSYEMPLQINRNIQQSNEILCRLIQQGNRQAVQDLCIKNQRLVGKYVMAYLNRYANRLEFEDLIQVGYIGLLKAAHKFDVGQGTSFSTYAVYWIKQAIAREIMEHGYAIRIPVHMMERINKVTAANNRLESLDLSLEQRLQELSKEFGYTEDEIRECFVLKQNYIGYTSLDAPVGEDDDASLGDLIPYNEAITTEDIVFDLELRKELGRVLLTLTQREQEILKLRFGWDDGKTRTLEEVGEIYQVTRERIRQIEAKALRKLRHPTRARLIKDYYV